MSTATVFDIADFAASLGLSLEPWQDLMLLDLYAASQPEGNPEQ